MDAQVLNFRRHEAGKMIGFFDLAVAGLVVLGCRAFKKADQLWFAFPSERIGSDGGEATFRDIVEATPATMKHLSGQVRAQLRAALEESRRGTQPDSKRDGKLDFGKVGFRTPGGENLGAYRSDPGDDIPF